jgi:hypothetical protein
MLSGSCPIIAHSNHTTFSQTQTDATVPLKQHTFYFFAFSSTKKGAIAKFTRKKPKYCFYYLQATFEKNYLVFSSQHSDGKKDGE